MPDLLQAHSLMAANYARRLFLLVQNAPDRRMTQAVQSFIPDEVAQMALYHDIEKMGIS